MRSACFKAEDGSQGSSGRLQWRKGDSPGAPGESLQPSKPSARMKPPTSVAPTCCSNALWTCTPLRRTIRGLIMVLS